MTDGSKGWHHISHLWRVLIRSAITQISHEIGHHGCTGYHSRQQLHNSSLTSLGMTNLSDHFNLKLDSLPAAQHHLTFHVNSPCAQPFTVRSKLLSSDNIISMFQAKFQSDWSKLDLLGRASLPGGGRRDHGLLLIFATRLTLSHNWT